MHWYNFRCKHGQIGMITPIKKWEVFYRKMFSTFPLSGQAETGNAQKQPAGNNLTNEEERQGMVQITSCPSQSALLTKPSITQSSIFCTSDNPSAANLFEKIVWL